MRDLRAKIIISINSAIANLSSLGRLVLGILVVIFIVAIIWILSDISLIFLVTVPERGGSFTAGMVGKPRLLNPVLASSDTDKDMDMLVYSGLTRWDTAEQKLIPDLAQSWTVSPDGQTYTFILKSGLTFQDGKPLTADDVVFTINAIENPDIHSPLAANWAGVSVQKIDARTVQFVLPAPYAPFLENTTIGILPAHLWQSISPDAFPDSNINTDPIGSGPYAINSINKDPSGAPESYSLAPFGHFALGKPYIGNFVVRFYTDNAGAAAAAEQHQINEFDVVSPNQVTTFTKDEFSVEQFAVPRVFGVFFNQSQNFALSDPTVRQALADATDRNAIVQSVFNNDATALSGPVPPVFLSSLGTSTINSINSSPSSLTASTTLANALLDKDGWIVNNDGIREKKRTTGTTTLSFAISTAAAPELVATANLLASQWQAIGADVSVKIFQSGFDDQVIQPRNYDALLFGQDVGRDFDLYPFWASSEVTDPGLNIALYTNPTVDDLLGNMRATTSPAVRASDYTAFASILSRDTPAIFLYAPHLIDAKSMDVAGVTQGPIATDDERFSDVYAWYVQTQTVWKIFAPKSTSVSY